MFASDRRSREVSGAGAHTRCIDVAGVVHRPQITRGIIDRVCGATEEGALVNESASRRPGGEPDLTVCAVDSRRAGHLEIEGATDHAS